ncbi:MAG: hypothetical protein AAFR37_19490 [Cyanobacteria bacterium J06628_3]
MKKRFNIILENEYHLKFAAFNDGWAGDFWVIAIESQDFPAIVEYTYNGAVDIVVRCDYLFYFNSVNQDLI